MAIAGELHVIDDRLISVTGLHGYTFFKVDTADIDLYATEANPGTGVFVQDKSGGQYIYPKVPLTILDDLTASGDIISTVSRLEAAQIEKQSLVTEFAPVNLKEVARQFNVMVDFVTTNGRLWVVEDPELFKGHPHYKDIFQLCFPAWDQNFDYQRECPK